MLYLAYISELARLVDGGYMYKFDFTEQPETVWGEYFNVVPTMVVPNLIPDEETISESWRVETKYHLTLANHSGCFSMQDSFDRIVPLGFVDIEEHDLIYYNDKVLKFDFGETEDEIVDKFNQCDFKITEKQILHEKEEIEEEFRDELVEEKHEEYKLEKESLVLTIGQEIKHEEIKKTLFNYGYKKVDYVFNEGEFAIRGSIIDIYPYMSLDPYKIDFDDNTIEKIYSFDSEESTPIKYFNELEIPLVSYGY